MPKRFIITSKFFTFIFFFMFTSFSVLAQADTPEAIGKIVALRGVVSAVSKDNQERRLKLKDPVFLSETIKTKQGRVQLMFKDNTLITLGRNTEMLIQEYLWKLGDKNSAMKTIIKEGSFRVMGGAITRDAPENFKTQTPVATIGIRGSMYAGMFRGGILSVMFQGGRGIYVANSSGTVDIDTSGFGTIVRGAGNAPEKPQRFDQDDLAEIEDGLTGDIDDQDDNTSGSESDSGETDISSDTVSDQNDAGDDTGSVSVSDETDEASESQDSTYPDIESDVSSTAADTVSTTVADAASTTVADTVSTYPSDTNAPETLSITEQIIVDMLQELGFSGSRSSAVPTTGITKYKGRLNDIDGTIEANDMVVLVNWKNKRVFAFDNKSDSTHFITNGFGFGDVNTDGTIDNMVVLGTASDNTIKAMSGSGTFGQFYGPGPDALGMAMEGNDINVQDQTIAHPWVDYLAAVKDSTGTSDTGSETWKGFFIGVTEDMADPNNNRRVFINNTSTSASGDFALTVDKDNGRIFGTLEGVDFIDPSANRLQSLAIGSATDNKSSVYVSDSYAGAILSGTGSVQEGGSFGDLKDHGNYLVASTETALDDLGNTVWGYWELAYEGPASNRDYHLHVPGSLWIAGVQTPAGSVPGGLNATYTGSAKGIKFDKTTQQSSLATGTVSLIINFGGPTNDEVSGTISFADWNDTTLTVGRDSTADTNGFVAKITGVSVGGASSETPVSSNVTGTYYGTAAASIGGNFSAKMGDTNITQYHGIFAGKK